VTRAFSLPRRSTRRRLRAMPTSGRARMPMAPVPLARRRQPAITQDGSSRT
jgi:hypothetical protein